METYHKIQTLFKRHLDGPKKGKMIRGEWARPEIGYLANNEWEFTEKVDGTNIRIRLAMENGGLKVEWRGRSDNATIPTPLNEWLQETFNKPHKFITWMTEKNLSEVVLFGEGYGPKIQNGGLYRDDASFVLFDVKIGEFWLDRHNVNDIADKLGIDAVPVLGTGTLDDAIEIVSSGLTWDKDGKLTKWHGGSVKKGLKSQWGDFEAEGIVARPVQPLFNKLGERIITKIKAVDFR